MELYHIMLKRGYQERFCDQVTGACGQIHLADGKGDEVNGQEGDDLTSLTVRYKKLTMLRECMRGSDSRLWMKMTKNILWSEL